ncbi:hypothetical protein R1A27_08420 [Methylobacterium sp. NMS12]|uniref:hypothetical protein n=1 Tax=Methylobacterium sp. NMS12 TaxID=3079766 RepID=UPI003F884E2F
MTRPAILVVVPTTRGPLVLRGLRPRPGLPAPAAFADGDYRPLPWSADYARLCGAAGPLARWAGRAPEPHELRLSGSFDAGRSWEVPVCLAHGLAEGGRPLAAAPAEADLILWATGAVDLDLTVLPGDYALLDKVERSAAMMAEAPDAALAVLLPDGPERAQAEAVFRGMGRTVRILPSHSVPEALAALTALRPPERAETPPARRWRRLALPAGAVAAAGLAGVLALGATRPDPVSDPPAGPATPPPRIEVRIASPIHVSELRAPAGSSCRRVAFGADPPERRPVPAESGDHLAASRLTPDLCGLAIGVEPGLRAQVGPELRDAALPAVRLADGALGYFLREGARQNLVYTVQAVPEAGTGAAAGRLVHALTR